MYPEEDIMRKQPLLELVTQLGNAQGEILAVTDKYILVKWIADNQYVSWRYCWTGTKYAFDAGHYMSCANNTENAAIRAFAKRLGE